MNEKKTEDENENKVKKPGLDIEVEIRGLSEYGVDFSYQM